MLQWAEGDDSARGDRLQAAGAEELRLPAAAVQPLYPAMNAYLAAACDAERAVPFGDLAQAGLEARLELERRARPR